MGDSPIKEAEAQERGIQLSFSACERALKRYLSRFIYKPEDIEDMTQETFLRAYSATQKRKIDFPKAYLFKVARNVAFAELSKKNRQLTDYLEELPAEELGDGTTIDDELMAQQRVKLYCDAIAEMPPRCRRVFLMRKVHAMSHKDIATELGVTVSAVERNITRGLVQFKRYVDSRDADADINTNDNVEIKVSSLAGANQQPLARPSSNVSSGISSSISKEPAK